MSTLQATNIKSAASASNNIVLDNAGNATFAGTAAMASSFLRNRIINGGFQIWQRGTSTSSVNVYLADRWLVTAGTSLTSSQSSDVPSGFRFSLSLAGVGVPQTIQRIESVNCYDLVGQNVTISFWAKQTVGAGSDSLGVQLYTANAADNFSALTLVSNQLLTGSTSWTRYTATFSSIPAAAANGLQVLIYANTAGSATFLVTGVQLEVGSAATPFERRQYGQELALCQRYAYAWGGLGAFELAAASTPGMYSDANQIQMMPAGINPGSMRTLAPTVTVVGTQGTDWAVQTSAGVNQTGFTITMGGGVIVASKTSHGITNCNLLVLTASGRIIVATEL